MYTNLDCFSNKRDELIARISEIKPDIIGLTEVNPKSATWELTPSELEVNGYALFCNLNGRGSALYVKDGLQAVSLSVSCKSSVWCTIQLKGRDTLLAAVVYRSPGSTAPENESFIEQFETVMKERYSHIVIMGDFNYPEIDWELQVSSASVNHPSHNFILNYKDWFLYQHVTQPTHFRAQQNANILDLIMTNEADMVDELHYGEPIGKSHHVVLDWLCNCYGPESQSGVIKYFYDRADFIAMKSSLKAYDWSELLRGKSVDDMWETIKSKIVATVDMFVPHRAFKSGSSRRRKPMWLNDRALGRIKRKKESFQRYKATRDGMDYLEYVKARNAAKTEIRKAVRDYEKEVAKLAKRNPKAFYKYVNSKLKARSVSPQLTTKDGSHITNPKDKANMFNNFFSSVFTHEDLTHIPSKPKLQVKEVLDDINFTVADVLQLLHKLNVSKSPGPDNIHPRILKECAEELAIPLYTMFRTSLTAGQLPQAWKEASVSPIFKKGSRSDVSNYRPISLTSVCCKTMEKLIREALLKHMISNDFLTDCQHGFVQGRSCTTQMLRVVDKLSEILDQGEAVDTIYLDFAKTFDTVPHERLLIKLESYGVEGYVLKWIRNFITSRKQMVALCGAYSSWTHVISGVPQGSVLGPVLFVCYINDMPESISSFLYIYADDTKIGRHISCDDDRSALQSDLDNLVVWSRNWQLRFNLDKCKVLHMGRGNMKSQYSMQDDNGQIYILQETAEEKDLGIWMDNSLKFSVHAARAASKANQILGLIRRSFVHLDIPLYISMVRPHLEYGNVIWHPQYKKDKEILENVQHRATRLVPSLSKYSYEERLRQMELPSLSYRRLRGDLIETFKYLHGIYRTNSSTVLPLALTHDGVTTRGQSLMLHKRECRTSLRANVLGFRIVNFWNSMPEDIVSAPSVNSFKGRFDKQYAHLRYCTEY